ncbi:MAG: transposase [Candidatus Obscuribacter sp.]|nr:transposase [Candidatus Obscuribacter sp.]
MDMLRQRIYGIAAGYEDCNDAGPLRVDAMHKLALGRDLAGGLALASQPSLSRFENNIDATSNAALQKTSCSPVRQANSQSAQGNPFGDGYDLR